MFQTLIDPAFLAAENGGTPVLDLNFAALKSLDSRITFVRGSVGTFINSAGLVETASAGVARFTHDPVTLESRGLLVEESRTNLALWSEDFSNAAWAKTESSITSNASAAPDGNLTADKLIELSATNVHNTNQTFAATSGTTYTFSVFLKKGERGFALMALIGAFTTTSIQINLTTGAVSTGTGTPLNATSQSLLNGWFRVAFSLAATSTATATALIYTSTDGVWANRTYTGDGTSGLYVWGAQLEAGAFATSYIQTTTASVTRAADVATMTGTNFSSWYNQNEGTFVAECIPARAAATGEAVIAVNDAGTSNRFTFNAARSGASNLSASLSADPAGSIASPFTYVKGETIKMAASYSTGLISLAINGADCGTLAATIASGLDRLILGNDNGVRPLNGNIARIRYFNRALASSVQALTT